MTNVTEAAKKGEGKVLANFAEVPAPNVDLWQKA
jgi:repressor of nif and glnA expression